MVMEAHGARLWERSGLRSRGGADVQRGQEHNYLDHSEEPDENDAREK